MTRTSLFLLAGLLTLPGCDTHEDGPPAFRHASFYADLQACAEDFTLVDGDWKEDFGDAAFYGPAYYVRAGQLEAKQAWLDRAQVAHERNATVVEGADLVNGDVNEIAMAALGMIEYMAATSDATHLPALNTTLDNLIELVDLLGGYLTEALIPGYAMENYGPVSINGLVALVFLQHAVNLGDENQERYTTWAEALAQRIRDEAWNGSYYEFNPERPELHLYPNLTLILLHTRLYQLTGDPTQLDRALATYQGVQPLKVETASGLVGPGRYFSPYSAEYMGAQTDDYTTLSSQNYLIFALSLLYQATGEKAFLEEIDPVLDFLEEVLQGDWCRSHFHKWPELCDPVCEGGLVCVQGECMEEACHHGVLHHWMDGRLALPQDPEFFCSGCNLQLLYSLWYRQEAL